MTTHVPSLEWCKRLKACGLPQDTEFWYKRCVHNHPSGSCEPSVEDRKITKEIMTVSKPIKINLVNHVIIGDNAFYSFADAGCLEY